MAANPQYTVTYGNSSSGAVPGQIHVNTTSNTLHVYNGNTYVPMTSGSGGSGGYTTTGVTFTTYNGDPNLYSTSRIFQTLEEKIEYQQQAYEEPRDHQYNPDSFGTCQDCYTHSLHRYSADKHLFVIDEELPWSDRLAS